MFCSLRSSASLRTGRAAVSQCSMPPVNPITRYAPAGSGCGTVKSRKCCALAAYGESTSAIPSSARSAVEPPLLPCCFDFTRLVQIGGNVAHNGFQQRHAGVMVVIEQRGKLGGLLEGERN